MYQANLSKEVAGAIDNASPKAKFLEINNKLKKKQSWEKQMKAFQKEHFHGLESMSNN